MVYKTVNLRTWTADTDGFVDMVTEDGPHFAIDAIDASQEDDVYCEFILEFTMKNAKGDFTVADLVIADKDDEIVYSLANDPCFSGITDFSRKQSSEPGFMWAPVISGGDASIRVDTAGENTYVPNRVLTLNIPENVEGETSYPENCAYLHLNVKDPGTTAFTEAGSPYPLRGMVKVENFAKNTSQRDGDAIEQAKNPAFLMGKSPGYVPRPDGRHQRLGSLLEGRRHPVYLQICRYQQLACPILGFLGLYRSIFTGRL